MVRGSKMGYSPGFELFNIHFLRSEKRALLFVALQKPRPAFYEYPSQCIDQLTWQHPFFVKRLDVPLGSGFFTH